MTALPVQPGWYGKLPTLGDFASRRLDAAFIEPWDTWLAQGIADLRANSGESWLDAYLASPVWRFVIMPGSLPGTYAGATANANATPLDTPAMAGVLMPSVDRVGRYFPLTLAAPLPQLPTDPAGIDALLNWLHQLDDTAADALHEDWSVDQLEAELARLPWSPPPVAEAAGLSALADVLAGQADHARLPAASRPDLKALLGQHAARQSARSLRGLSFWLAEPADGAPRGFVARGLPQGGGFAALLGSPQPKGPAA